MIKRACVVTVALAVCFASAASAEEEEKEHKLKHFVFRGFFAWTSAAGEATDVGPTTPTVFRGEATGSSICEFSDGCFSISQSEGSGFQANFEYRATHLIGVEIGGWTSEIDGRLLATVAVQDPRQSPLPCRTTLPGTSIPAFDVEACLFQSLGGPFDEEVQTDMLYVGANFHLWKKNSPLDVYVGPFYGAMNYDDGTITLPDQAFVVFDDDDNPFPVAVPGVNLAFDYDDEESWGVNGGFDMSIGKHWFVGATLRFVSSEPTMTLSNRDSGQVVDQFDVKINPFVFSVGGGYKF